VSLRHKAKGNGREQKKSQAQPRDLHANNNAKDEHQNHESDDRKFLAVAWDGQPL
jgi:hypothetical protein